MSHRPAALPSVVKPTIACLLRFVRHVTSNFNPAITHRVSPPRKQGVFVAACLRGGLTGKAEMHAAHGETDEPTQAKKRQSILRRETHDYRESKKAGAPDIKPTPNRSAKGSESHAAQDGQHRCQRQRGADKTVDEQQRQ